MWKYGLAILALFAAGTAQAQLTCTYPLPGQAGVIDCGEGCSETRYGLSTRDDFAIAPDGTRDARVNAGDPTAFVDRNSFTGSYALNRGTGDPFDPTCDGEGGFVVVNGTFVVREQDNCDPFDMDTNPDGCPIEFATDLNVNDSLPDHFFSEARIITDYFVCGFQPPQTLLFCELFISVASSGRMVGVGTRLPDTDRCPTCTRIKFDLDAGGCLGSPGGSQSQICCNSDEFDAIDICQTIGGIGVAKYPATPNLSSFGGNYKDFPDFLFDGDIANHPPYGKFEIDLDKEVPGQRYGVCLVNRDVGCDCGENGASCGLNDEADPCPTLDADPDAEGLQPDSCDLLDKGYRLSPEHRFADGSPNPNECAGTLYVFRGTPNQDCLISTTYQTTLGFNGDPGPDCSVRNFGPHTRPDLNCNNVDDTTEGALQAGGVGGPVGDLCPFYSEVDGLLDTNGDGRGDECQCGDANGDGAVDVNDILAVNDIIFNPLAVGWFGGLDPALPSPYQRTDFQRLFSPTADTNNSAPLDSTPGDPFDPNLNWNTGGTVNVDDILGVNQEIFNPLSATCARSPVAGQ
jgi:hypothetical protein